MLLNYKKNRKRLLFAIFVVLILLINNFVFFVQVEPTFAVQGKKIVIDAGHGGIDGGSVGDSIKIKESDVNLAISKKLKHKLESCGYQVVMTRNDENGLYGDSSKGFKRRDMNKRCEIINNSNADFAISIHLNKCEVEYRFGAIVFYKRNEQRSQELAENIQEEINSLYVKPRDKVLPRSDFYLFKHSQIPIVLVECGFLSNNKEEYNLSTELYQDKLAESILRGINKYYSEKNVIS